MKRRDPDDARRKLFEIAQGQCGYFTAKQAVKAGYSRRLHTYHVDRGHWHRIDRGIYRLRDYPFERHEDLVRWSLWSGGKAVISHETAAAVHKIGDFLPARIHLTVPPGFRKKASGGAILYKADLPESDVTTAYGFRITRPLRTFLDMVRSGTESDWVIRAFREAVAEGRVDPEAFRNRIPELPEAAQERARQVLRLSEEFRSAI